MFWLMAGAGRQVQLLFEASELKRQAGKKRQAKSGWRFELQGAPLVEDSEGSPEQIEMGCVYWAGGTLEVMLGETSKLLI
jgi:hypothetical protein